MKAALLVFAGGGLGSLFRYLINLWIRLPLPFGTLLVNTLSSFILGITVGFLLSYPGRPLFSFNDNTWYLLVGTGFCGGLSTFSAFTLDNYKAMITGTAWLLPALNIAANVVFCFISLALGVRLGKLF